MYKHCFDELIETFINRGHIGYPSERDWQIRFSVDENVSFERSFQTLLVPLRELP